MERAPSASGRAKAAARRSMLLEQPRETPALRMARRVQACRVQGILHLPMALRRHCAQAPRRVLFLL